MFKLNDAPPSSEVRPVTDVIHGESITDSYRWLEEQDSGPTRDWIKRQTLYARHYLDNVEGRERIRTRVRELLAIETYDSLRMAAGRYFFRKRLPEQEQPCIYMRDGTDSEDCLLVDPSSRQTGHYTAVKPLLVSRDGHFLLYEVKQGGERTGTFEILNVETKKTLPDVLSRGYLRGFAFTPDGEGFCYVHEPSNARNPFHRAAYFHRFGSSFSEDQEMFCAGEHEKARLCLVSDRSRLGFLFYKFANERAPLSISKRSDRKNDHRRSSKTSNTVFALSSFRARFSHSQIAGHPTSALSRYVRPAKETRSGSTSYRKLKIELATGWLWGSACLCPTRAG